MNLDFDPYFFLLFDHAVEVFTLFPSKSWNTTLDFLWKVSMTLFFIYKYLVCNNKYVFCCVFAM